MKIRINIAKMIRESFVLRTFAAFFLCVFVVSAGLSGIYIHTQLGVQEELMKEKGILLSNVLAHNVRVGIFSNSSVMVESPVNSVLGQKGVEKVSVWDYEGLCILSMDNDINASITGEQVCDDVSEDNGYIECLVNKVPYYSENGNDLNFWAPVLVHKASVNRESVFQSKQDRENVRVIGAVRVTMDKKLLWAKFRELVINSFILGLFALCCGLIIAYLQVIGITRPLKRLKNDVYNFSIKGFRGRITIETDDEIGKLAKAFNDMARVLERRDISLEESHEKLERMVEDRTSELVKTNIRLNEEIVERLSIQKSLRESEKLYRGVFTSSTDAFFICDKYINLLDVNPAACELYGYTKDEFVRIKLKEIIHPDYHDMLDTFQKEIDSEGLFYSEVVNITKDKASLNVELWAVKYLIEDMDKVLITVRDISETKALQNQLIRSERLVATGQLAASVAHEINSPLQGITSLLSVMKETCRTNEMITSDLHQVKDAFDSIRSIVKKLLDLNRPDEEKKAVNIHRVIENTIQLVRSYLMKNRVSIYFYPSDDEPVIIGSPQQIGQCFMNLINNSVESLGDMDDYKKDLEKGVPSRREIIIRTEKNVIHGNYIITIEDTGAGIPDGALSHLFQPFFTRNKKKGMGIGLAVCQGIIEDHDGTIIAGNSANGALFTIALPVGG